MRLARRAPIVIIFTLTNNILSSFLYVGWRSLGFTFRLLVECDTMYILMLDGGIIPEDF